MGIKSTEIISDGGAFDTTITSSATAARSITLPDESGELLTDNTSGLKWGNICPFGAKADNTGKFLVANGTSDKADDSSKPKTRHTIPISGTLTELVYLTKEGDTTTQMKIHINGVVEATVLLTNINANFGGVESISVSVNVEDEVEIEYDAGQKPGECTMSLNIQPT